MRVQAVFKLLPIGLAVTAMLVLLSLASVQAQAAADGLRSPAYSVNSTDLRAADDIFGKCKVSPCSMVHADVRNKAMAMMVNASVAHSKIKQYTVRTDLKTLKNNRGTIESFVQKLNHAGKPIEMVVDNNPKNKAVVVKGLKAVGRDAGHNILLANAVDIETRPERSSPDFGASSPRAVAMTNE